MWQSADNLYGASLGCELEGIALKIQQNLLQSVLVGVEQVLSLKTYELTYEVDAVELCVVLLKLHDLCDGFPDVKSWNINSEVVRFYLSQWDDVAHGQVQQLSGWRQSDCAQIQILCVPLKLKSYHLGNFRDRNGVLIAFNDKLDLIDSRQDRVQWIPHLMWH